MLAISCSLISEFDWIRVNSRNTTCNWVWVSFGHADRGCKAYSQLFVDAGHLHCLELKCE